MTLASADLFWTGWGRLWQVVHSTSLLAQVLHQYMLVWGSMGFYPRTHAFLYVRFTDWLMTYNYTWHSYQTLVNKHSSRTVHQMFPDSFWRMFFSSTPPSLRLSFSALASVCIVLTILLVFMLLPVQWRYLTVLNCSASLWIIHLVLINVSLKLYATAIFTYMHLNTLGRICN